MGKKNLLKEGDDPYIDGLLDEIEIVCDDLVLRGRDLSKIKFGYGKSYTADQLNWMGEFDEIRKKLLGAGVNLNIPITKKIVG